VVGKFVEFYGPGVDNLTLADQATIANMAPEYGATCGFFPVSRQTIDYLTFSGRDTDRVALVEAYAKAQGMWRDADSPDPVYTDTLELDLGTSSRPSPGRSVRRTASPSRRLRKASRTGSRPCPADQNAARPPSKDRIPRSRTATWSSPPSPAAPTPPTPPFWSPPVWSPRRRRRRA
jgi:hypothetical protein